MHKSVRFLVILLVSCGLSLAAGKAPAAQPDQPADIVEVAPLRTHQHMGERGERDTAAAQATTIFIADTQEVEPAAETEEDSTEAGPTEADPTEADPTEAESAEMEDPSEAEMGEGETGEVDDGEESPAESPDVTVGEGEAEDGGDEAEGEEGAEDSGDEVDGEDVEGDGETAADPEAAPDPDEIFRRELLIEADALYEAGDIAGATALYREAKNYTWRADAVDLELPPEPFSDEASLSPGAAVYWRESARGVEAGRESQTLVPLALLTEEHPAFIPGHLRYVELLLAYEQPEEASAVYERALTLYPAQPELLQAQVQLMMDQEEWIEASIASRQFSLLNPDHPEAANYQTLADENLDRFKSSTNAQIRNNAIANIITGVAGYVVTGGLYGPFTALNSTIALLQGEENIGEQVSNQAQQQLPMLEDEAVLAYVDEMGQKLAAVAGRDEFEYEFHVILDEDLNAFALPGGKIFVNAGAILETDSEAELAGLLAHELSHSVLSHGFQLVTRGNLTASVTQYLPLPGLVTNVLVNGYSRQMERQADIVGTQILSASGYAADGMYGLMSALNESYGDRANSQVSWLSTHPAPQTRLDYIQTLIEFGGYNRYGYEGVLSHEAIQELTQIALDEHEAEEAADGEEDIDIEDAVEDIKEEREQAEAEASEVEEPEEAEEGMETEGEAEAEAEEAEGAEDAQSDETEEIQ
ncbi:MAG: M48 family metalloprotease [Cyanobacteria bacterium P01_A01_bin.114]